MSESGTTTAWIGNIENNKEYDRSEDKMKKIKWKNKGVGALAHPMVDGFANSHNGGRLLHMTLLREK